MDKPLILNNKGFTLMELIIVLALIGIVLSGTFTIISSGNNISNKGNEQYNIQSDARRISDTISDSIRYGAQVQILPKVPSTLIAGYDYIYLQIDNDLNSPTYNKPIAIIKETYNAATNNFDMTTIASKNNTKIDYGLTFSKGGTNVVNITVDANDGSQKYEIINNIELLNANIAPINLESSGNAICYRNANDILNANMPPVATLVNITGSATVGSILTGGYTYDDIDGDSESGSTFTWYRSSAPSDPIPTNPDDASYNWTVLQQHTGQGGSDSYTVTPQDASCVLCFEVTPKSVNDQAGTPVKSDPIKVVSIPVAKDVTVGFSSGNNDTIGSILQVTYSFYDPDANSDALKTVYTWYRANNTKGNNDTKVISITGDSGKYYTLTSDDKNAYIFCIVTPAADDGEIGADAKSNYVQISNFN